MKYTLRALSVLIAYPSEDLQAQMEVHYLGAVLLDGLHRSKRGRL